MDNNPTRTPSQDTPSENNGLPEGKITPALVDEITAKVYEMILHDLRIEQERRWWSLRKPFVRRG